MRTLAASIVMILAAPIAAADRAPAAAPAAAAPPAPARAASQPPALTLLAPIDLSTIPEPCKPLAKQAFAPSVSTALSARISLASCMADRAVAPLLLCDCGESILAVDAAAAPAIAMLDAAIEAGDPVIQVVAEHAVGQLYTGFAARLVATLPRVGADATDAEVALRDMRKQTLEAQLTPWREAAMTAFQHVVETAKAHPEIAGNPAVVTAVRDSQQRLAAEVAAR